MKFLFNLGSVYLQILYLYKKVLFTDTVSVCNILFTDTVSLYNILFTDTIEVVVLMPSILFRSVNQLIS